MRIWGKLAAAACIVLAGLGCGSNGDDGGYEPAPRGDRVLGLDVSAAEDGDYPAALALAVDTGVQTIDLSLDWKATQEDTACFCSGVSGMAVAWQDCGES